LFDNPQKADAGILICYNMVRKIIFNPNNSMEPSKDEYKQMITEIIKKQIVILGPQIAVLKARNIPGLKVTDGGDVTDIEGTEQVVLHKLIDEYVALSGEIVKNAVNSIFEKYPSIKG
jgi:hypothetical protein